MKKTIFRALAIVVASSLAYAGSESEEWLSLDKELAKLNSSLAPQGGSAMEINGFFRASYLNSSDFGEDDLGGFSIDNARFKIHGDVGDYGYMLEYEASTGAHALIPFLGSLDYGPLGYFGYAGSVGMLDAYAYWNINDQIKLQLGQFRPRVLHSSHLDPSDLLFIDRSIQGMSWAWRDSGLEISGAFDQLSWWIGAMNGLDSIVNEMSYYARVEFDAMGEGRGDVQGAFGAPEDNSLTIGAAFFSDQTVDGFDADAYAIDAGWTGSGFSASGEFVNYFEDFFTDDSSQWNMTLAYLFAPEWEGAVRYEDLDEDNVFGADTAIWTAGINRYVQGHDVKWSLNWSNFDVSDGSTDASEDFTAIQLGLTVGW